MKVNWRFVGRSSLVLFTALILVVAGMVLVIGRLSTRPSFPTLPAPPTILAPQGRLPGTHIGFEEWVRFGDQAFRHSGSGLIFRLPDGQLVGATTAHSLGILRPEDPLQAIAFRLPGSQETLFISTVLYGSPGRARLLGLDLSFDYVLLRIDEPVDPRLATDPDPRGLPLPGEAVVLYSGMADSSGSTRQFEGAVLTADDKAVWILMDDSFSAGMMSGSPVLSAHTGKLIGMVLAGTQDAQGLVLGLHPVGSLLSKALEASSFAPLATMFE